jgi:hypothetical protein
LLEKIKDFCPDLLANFESIYKHMIEKFDDFDYIVIQKILFWLTFYFFDKSELAETDYPCYQNE